MIWYMHFFDDIFFSKGLMMFFSEIVFWLVLLMPPRALTAP